MSPLIIVIVGILMAAGIPLTCWLLERRDTKRINALPKARIVHYAGGFTVERRIYRDYYRDAGWVRTIEEAKALMAKHERDGEVVQ
jgi:hypothetical protein